MSRILLTGATGYLGKQILRTLVEQKHEVLALVRPSGDGSTNRLASIGLPVGAPVKALTGDLTEQNLGLSAEDWRLALTAEIIVHAGGPMQLNLSEREANQQILRAIDNILELAKGIQSRNGLSRFVHLVGFMSPFHDGMDVTSDVESMGDFMPKSAPYERAKFLADLRVRKVAKQDAFPLTVVNPATVIGSSKTGETEQLAGFGLMVDAVRRGLMSVTPGGSDHWLPLITIDDLARTTVEAATSADTANRTYYSLDRNSPDMVRLLRIIADELRMPRPKFSMPLALMRSIMEHGVGKLTGILPQSLDFVTTKRFHSAVSFSSTTDILPAVIADLDYRLARKAVTSTSNTLQRIRLERTAGLYRPGSGTPWVILHGLFSGAEELVQLANALDDAPVYLLDIPGFGRSPLPKKGQDFEAGIIEAIVSALMAIPGPVRLVGHSFGALVAARVASVCPDKVLDLQLLQPPLQRPNLPWPLSVTGRFPALTRNLLRFGVTESSLKAGFNDSVGMPTNYAERVMADMTSPRVRYATAHSYKILTDGYLGISLGNIKVPVHLVWGTQDDSFPVSWGKQAIQNHTHVRMTTVDFGHQFPISHPTETATALQQHNSQVQTAS